MLLLSLIIFLDADGLGTINLKREDVVDRLAELQIV